MIVQLKKARGAGFVRAFAMLAFAVLALMSTPGAHAQEDVATLERRIKAAFIFKFAGYVEWPENSFAQPGSPFTVAVIGDDELAAELVQVSTGRVVEGRPLVVRKTRGVESALDAHMVFIGRAEIARLPQLAKLARARPVLILSDSPGALSQGSMINFTVAEQRVKFEIFLEEAERHALKLSSRLLAVAVNVRRSVP